MTSENSSYVPIDTVIHEIKQDYLFGCVNSEGNKEFLSLIKLAEKYNVSYNTLKKKYSTPEKWGQEKKNVKCKIQEKVENKKTEIEAEKIVQLDSKYENYFSKIAKKTMRNMQKLASQGRLRSSDMLNYSNTLLNCYEGEKVAHGESLDNKDTGNGWDVLANAFKKSSKEQKTKDKE